MAEYIDREELLKSIGDDVPFNLAMVLSHILNAPAADVAPVVHGRWTRYVDDHENLVKYICSNCGDYHAFRIDAGSPFLTSEYTFNENYNYCRRCGAKMDEKEDTYD